MTLLSRIRRLARGVLLPLLLVTAMLPALSGCNYVIAIAYLIHGPPSIQPDFEKTTGESMTDYHTVVAVVCYAPTEVKWDFEAIDFEIAEYVTKQMFMHQIRVIDPDRIRDWLDKHSEWDKPEEIGAAFHATHVVYIDLQGYHLYEKNSTQLFRGRAEAMVSVWKMDGEEGDKIYSKELTSLFPLKVARSVYETSYYRFKKEYLVRLSEEIGRLFYPYYNGDDIKDAT